MKKPKAIIVGAGIGGLATGARLARIGFEVTIFEKNSQSGGRCNQIIKEGHCFDVGPTFLLLPDTYRETFEDLGEKMEDHLELQRVDPTYCINFKDKTKLILTSDLHQMEMQLEAIESGSFRSYLNYLEEGSRHHELSMAQILEKPFYKLHEYINPENIALLLKVKALNKHYGNISRYFKSDKLRAAFTFQDSYISVSPYEAMATFSMLQYTELVNGVWLPRGGMYQVIKALTKVAQKLDVKIYYNSPVKKINLRGNKIKGVSLGNGEKYNADLIISNADLPYTYNQLLPKSSESGRLLAKRYSCSCLMFCWGVSKQYVQLETHNLFLSGNYKESFDAVLKKLTLPRDASFYIHSPRQLNPSMSPKGQDSLVVIFPIGHINPSDPQNWQKLKRWARSLAFRRLAQIGIKDIKRRIKFEITIDPTEWRERYNLTNGSILGLNHDFWQMGYFRPQNKHKKFRNLYFVGADTHPGSGLPAVLLSARHVSERIKNDFN